MTTAAPSAPAPAAPVAAPAAAPATSSVPSAPAFGSSPASARDFWNGVTGAPGVKPAAAAPAAPAPAVAAPAPVAQPPVNQPAAINPAVPPVPAADGGQPPAAGEPAATAPAKLYAGRFKEVPELEVAYEASGREARRLVQVVKDYEAQHASLATEHARVQSELENIKTLQELGPEMPVPSAEEMDSWSAAKVAQYFDSKSKRETLKRNLEEKRAAAQTQQKAAFEEKRSAILNLDAHMMSNAEKFPQYAEMGPVMEDLMQLEPGIIGHAKTPLILYLAAQGHMALQARLAGAAKTKASADAAAAVAAAAVAGAGAPGGAHVAPAPGTGTAGQPHPDSDEAHQQRILAASRRLHRPVFEGI